LRCGLPQGGILGHILGQIFGDLLFLLIYQNNGSFFEINETVTLNEKVSNVISSNVNLFF
jgi:hypothetical protein